MFERKHFYLDHFWIQLWNSVLIAVAVAAITLFVATSAAFAISRLKVRGGRTVMNLALFTYFIPAAFLAVPMYKTMGNYGLLNSQWALILAMVTIASPYCIWVLKQASDKLPYELDEAARMDGASPLQLFRLVYLPLMVPSLVAVGTYALLLAWNEYLYAFLLLSNDRSVTLAVALGNFLSADDSPWELLMATGLIYALPPAAIYYAFKRYMVGGSLPAPSRVKRKTWHQSASRTSRRPTATRSRCCTASASTSSTASSSCWSAPRAAASRRLLRMLAGLEEITGGEITIDGKVVNDLESKDRDIAMVFQSYALYPHMTVGENMGFSLRLRNADPTLTAKRVNDAARILNLDKLLDRHPRELSGGQRQRVAMGRAIVRDPKVFLFDEPLSNLDAKLRVAMRAEIKALHQRLKTTTVYVTHDQIEAMTMADRIVVMHDGIIEQIGTPLELYDRPGNLFVAQFIGSPSMNVVEGVLRGTGGNTVVEAAGTRWPVPAQVGGSDGQAVHYGIRPGDIHLAPAGQGIAAKVIVVEPTGAETELLLQVGQSGQTTQLVVVIHGRTGAKPDETVYLAIDADKAHVFDTASGKRLG